MRRNLAHPTLNPPKKKQQQQKPNKDIKKNEAN